MGEWPDDLPPRIRARVVSFAAQALGALATDHVPASLKRVASFTPAKRARLAGGQILELLAQDPEFRERIGVQARAQQGAAAEQLGRGEATTDAAALAVIDQPDDWRELVGRATEAEHSGQAAAEAEQAVAETARLREQLEGVQREAEARVRKTKADLDRIRKDNADLRRKLGDSRSAARNAEQEAEKARREAAAAREEGASALSQAEAEVRRLRAQVEALETEVARSQRSTRSARDEATVRTRLLLDTLLDASQGLRRELALPVVEGTPADSVAAALGEEGSRGSSGARSARPDDPALVEQVLSLPQAHLVIDGYNVTRLAWESSTLEIQRNRLLAGLGPLVAQSGAEVTVVFDGYKAEQRPLLRAPRGVRVVFSPVGQIADDLIREFVAVEPEGRVVGVVTNDREIIGDVTRKRGVRAVPSEALVALLAR